MRGGGALGVFVSALSILTCPPPALKTRAEALLAKQSRWGCNSIVRARQVSSSRGGGRSQAGGGDGGRWQASMEWKEECQQFDYVFHGPLRIVPPYTFPQKANAKARWQGRRLQDVFSAEFPHACEDDPLGFFTKAVEEGRLYINGDVTTSAEHRIKPADEIVHLVHNHEPPVSGSIEIIFQDEELLVINKPASLPCHPGGRFRRNTVVGILAKEMGIYDVKNPHRLDRLTSGVLLLAKTRGKAESLIDQFKGQAVRKAYLAKVSGRLEGGREILIDQPIICESKRWGRYCVDPAGKSAQTLVSEVVYDETKGESILLCEPLTGRTHQIRLHLAHIGLPIADDPIYNPSFRGGAAYLGAGDEEVLGLERNGWNQDWCSTCQEAMEAGVKGYYIKRKIAKDDSSAMSICLHAYSIEFQGSCFRAPPPEWAQNLTKPRGISIDDAIRDARAARLRRA